MTAPYLPPAPSATPTDPKFVAAVRRLVTARRNAASSGAEIPHADQDAFLREETGGKFGLSQAEGYLASISSDVGVRNVGRSALQGATFGFGDEILGALPESIGGGEAAKEDMRLRQELFQRAHPVVDGAANIAGGVASSLLVPGGGLLGEGATVGQAALRGAAIGGLAGGLSGAGNAEGTLRQRLPGAAAGAAGGILVGGALPALAAGARSFSSPTIRAGRRLMQAVQESGGVDAVAAANTTAKQLGRGQSVMLADLSPHLQAATDFAATNSDGVRVPLTEALVARQHDMAARLVGDVGGTAIGNADATATQAALAKSRKAWADPAYAAVRDVDNPVISDEVAATLKQPYVKAALAKARKDGLVGNTPDTGSPSVGHLIKVSRALRSQAGRAFTAGDGDLGASLKQAATTIEGQLEIASPYYKSVQAEYARRKGLETALEQGVKAYHSNNLGGINATVASLTPDELLHYRQGLASELLNQLNGKKTNVDATSNIVDAGGTMGTKLKLIFGDAATFDDFMAKAKLERQMKQTMAAVGGSPTARRAAAAEHDPAELASHVALGGVHGAVHATKGILSKMGLGAMRRNTAATLGPTLMTQGSDNIAALLARLKMPEPLLGPMFSQGLPGGAAVGVQRGLLGP